MSLADSGSIGPVDFSKPKHGQCRYCYEEFHDRETHFYFAGGVRMVGPVCKHRLPRPKKQGKMPAHWRFEEAYRNGYGIAEVIVRENGDSE